MKNFLIVLFSLTVCSSCATFHGTISSSVPNRPVQYVDIAYGVSQADKILGMGGISQDALVFEAKRELIKNRPLLHNEEYLNFTVDFKYANWIFYHQTRVTLSADVIRFTNDSTSEPFTENYKNKLLGKQFKNVLFAVGDSIIDRNWRNGTIISFVNQNTVRVLYKSKNNKFHSRCQPINDIYSTCQPYKGHKIGEEYTKEMLRTWDNKEIKGTIIGLGLTRLMLKQSHSDIYYTFDY